MVNALILGLKDKTLELRSLLEEKGLKVTLAETMEEIPEIRHNAPDYRLAFLTDSFSAALDASLLAHVRRNCQPECMFCLSSDADHGKERILRSAGLVFFDSYNNFLELADRIIQTALAASERKKSARELEHRLLKRTPVLKSRIKRYTFPTSLAITRLTARNLDISAALMILILAGLPILIVLLLRKIFTGAPVFESAEITTGQGRRLKIRRFCNISPGLRDIPSLAAILSGKSCLFTITGPRNRSFLKWMPLAQRS